MLNLDESKIKRNADGDVDMTAIQHPGLDYATFRYPSCEQCRSNANIEMEVDKDGAWLNGHGGVLKPKVVFFGDTVDSGVRRDAERAIAGATHVLVIGSSLEALSAYRLVSLAKQRNCRVGIINWGGRVRGEEALVQDGDLRVWWKSSELLTEILAQIID